jgi:SAM-dependent methyltransferase
VVPRPLRTFARLVRRLALGGGHRDAAWLRLSRPDNLFQPYGDTGDDRYPGIFRFARDDIGDGPDRRLLSFGCSTGEEVFALRGYFPEAEIVGLDIDRRRIAVCRRRLAVRPDPAIRFAVAGSAAGEPADHYHAIFAMAVFRHGDLGAGPPRCDPLIRFADFADTVAGLARCLRPGGLLALRFANFRFCDTASAAGFDPVLSDRMTCGRRAPPPLYGPDDCRIDGVDTGIVFRKRRADQVNTG